MFSTAIATDSCNGANDIASAIQSIRAMVQLMRDSRLNQKRFDSCKDRVLRLNLSEDAKNRTHVLLESAANYIKFGELGALKFELNLLAQFLDVQLENQVRKSVT